MELDLLAPERTLLEKLLALHMAASNAPSDDAVESLRRTARYYYDIKLLLDDEAVLRGLTALGDLAAYSRTTLLQAGVGQPFTAPDRPEGGYAESPAFNLSEANEAIVTPAYEAAMAFVFAGEERPSLDECLATVRAKAEIL